MACFFIVYSLYYVYSHLRALGIISEVLILLHSLMLTISHYNVPIVVDNRVLAHIT